MTDMMNMAINDMELDNVTGGATRTVKNKSRRTATYGMRSRLRTVLTTPGSREA